MLLKNNRNPALAYAACPSNNAKSNATDKDFITRMSADADDFGSFSSSTEARKSRPPRKAPQKAPQKSPRKAPKFNLPINLKNLNVSPFILAGIAVVAVIIIIALMVAIFNIPQSSSKISDTVYFTYIDEEENYNIVVNGKKLNKTFENKIELIPADDNSFAYVLETIEDSDEGDGGIMVHILTGTKLKTVIDKNKLADECVAFATLEPGIIYTRNGRYSCYSNGNNATIIAESSKAKNFIISADASTIIYSLPNHSDESDGEILRYYNNSSTIKLAQDIIPIAISANGRYVYGKVSEDHAKQPGALCFIDTKSKEKEVKILTNNSKVTFGEITNINAAGNEIIFYGETSKGVYSFFCDVKTKKSITLGQGVFEYININSEILAPDTFIGSYFSVENASLSNDEDGELVLDEDGSLATYRLNKDKSVKVIDAVGKFSPDGKYLYFINNNSELERISLSAKDYEESKEFIDESIVDFAITQKGNVYMLSSIGSDAKKPEVLIFWNASTKARETIFDDKGLADAPLMICADTVYFSVKSENKNGETATSIYASTDGSNVFDADFGKIELTKSPTFVMGTGKNGYAYVTDKSGESDMTMLFFTSNGKKFELVCDNCRLPQSNTSIG